MKSCIQIFFSYSAANFNSKLCDIHTDTDHTFEWFVHGWKLWKLSCWKFLDIRKILYTFEPELASNKITEGNGDHHFFSE
jgi:hypothetical protein